MAAIAGTEAFWGDIKPSAQELAYINDSPTLVQQLLQYQTAYTNKLVDVMKIDPAGGTEFNGSYVQFASNYNTWSPEMFVGELAHEIGHFVNQAADTAFTNQYEVSSNDPNAYSIDAMLGLHREGEAVYNNYVVQQEISAATAGQVKIYLAGALNVDGTSTGLQQLLDAQHAFDQADGYSPTEDRNLMIEQAMGVYALLPGSANGLPYYNYYGQVNGAQAPAQAPELANVTFTDPMATGNFTTEKEVFTSGETETQNFSNGVISSSSLSDQFGNVISQTVYSHGADGSYIANIYDGTGNLTGQDQFHSDGSEVAYQLLGNGTQNATVYNAAGQETEYATFGANGAKTQDTFYDATTGRATEQDEYSADGSAVAHLFNTDGTQNAIVFNAAGHETENASFGTNGQLTQDTYYDASTGRMTEQDNYNADGSAIAHLFNADGTQNAIVFNAAGHETENASFGTNGQMTQDTYYDASTGRMTEQDNYNADGSAIAHLFNADGTQNAIVFNAAGHETENASFGVNGQKTQDVFFDATTGRETQENDINADGSQVDHVFNTNGTQTAYVFNAAGHETEQANFGTNGKLTQDYVFDGNTGRELQETDYNADGSGVAHIFNPDGTQNAAVFDPNGHVSEYATFGANGQKTQDIFYDTSTGRETQENDFNPDGSAVAHVFNPDGSQTATVYNAAGHETEYAMFNTSGQKTDDYFFDGTTGRETEYNQYHGDGSMTAWQYNTDNSTDAIIFNGNGQEIEYDTYNANGQLTGFTQFTYGAGGGYNAVAYGPTGYELGWSDYSSSGGLISSGGGQYDFTLDDGYECTGDMAGFAQSFESDFGYSCDFDF
ncbi:Peptidase M10A and M12B, matrixin and adamalysin (fragment) [Paraburkholderia ribeironis]|uniref:Peptidase M10A and M12B, matrixin and adamalysin n=1 Tax=Paraburkholderia ribeironis TaxID=1247936 RepID=A0A1N7SMX2_9BURK